VDADGVNVTCTPHEAEAQAEAGEEAA